MKFILYRSYYLNILFGFMLKVISYKNFFLDTKLTWKFREGGGAMFSCITGSNDVITGFNDVITGFNDVTTGSDDISTGSDNVSTRSADISTESVDISTGPDDISTESDRFSIGSDDLTGCKQIYVYPDERTALVGEFRKDK